jgi:hypothetical protein
LKVIITQEEKAKAEQGNEVKQAEKKGEQEKVKELEILAQKNKPIPRPSMSPLRPSLSIYPLLIM